MISNVIAPEAPARSAPAEPWAPSDLRLDARNPERTDRAEVGAAQVRDEAGQPGQQAAVHGPRRRLRPGRRLGRRARWPSWATTSSASASRTSPRRAHSIAAQGGINAAKNYQNDGDSVYRLFYDTVKGGDFRAREANVYRLAELSVNIIDQCVAQGVPFAREYGGLLDNRSFGGAQVSRTFYARGQTGQQLLLGAYQALCRQIGLGKVEMHPRTEMLDLVVVDGRARGIVIRDLVTGEIESHAGDAVVLATGGYGNVFYLSTNAKGCNVTATWRALQARRALRQPLLHADPPDLHPGHRRLPVEADADERVAAQRRPHLGAEDGRRHALARRRSPRRARLLPGAQVPELRQPGAARHRLARGQGGLRRGPRRRPGRPRRLPRLRRRHQAARQASHPPSATATCSTCTSGSPARTPTTSPMRIYPAVHYTMGGLWVDYNLMSNHPGPVRARRGQLLRPRRQPPRRQRADAGAGRRLLRPAVHDRQLPGRAPKPGRLDARQPGLPRGRGRGRARG